MQRVIRLGGSRAGAIIAACWASLMYYGRSGYVDCTRKIVEVTRKIAKGLENIEGLKIIGVPEVSVVAIGEITSSLFLGEVLTGNLLSRVGPVQYLFIVRPDEEARLEPERPAVPTFYSPGLHHGPHSGRRGRETHQRRGRGDEDDPGGP